MRIGLKGWIWGLAVAWLLGGQTVARGAQDRQETPAVAQRNPARPFPARPGRFAIEVAVTGEDGRPVEGLAARDFQLEDAGQPSHIFSVEPPQSSPEALQVIFILDQLNGMNRSLAKDLEAFLRRNGGQLTHTTILYELRNDGLLLLGEASRDGNRLAEAVAHPSGRLEEQAGRRLQLRTGNVDQFLSPEFREQASLRALGTVVLGLRDEPGRKLVVWVGAGWAPPPAVNFGLEVNYLGEAEELWTRMRESRVVLDQVNDEIPGYARKWLKQVYEEPARTERDASSQQLAVPVLVSQSGGESRYKKDVSADVEQCVRDAEAMYELTFDPADTETVDEFRPLKVMVNRAGAVVRTWMGYYDEPAYYDHPNPRVERVSVAELERVLAERHDAELTRRLANMRLTERLSTPRLNKLLAEVKDEGVKQQLTALADTSALLNLPADEVPAKQAPPMAEQEEMMRRMFEYLKTAIPRLPDFFAERDTVFYEQKPLSPGETWKTYTGDTALRAAATSRATVLYRDGKEVVSDEVNKQKRGASHHRSLEMRGAFGTALVSLLSNAAAQGNTVGWDHWEQGEHGLEAVFHFHVAEAGSLFQTSYCCTPKDNGTAIFRRQTEYRGQFAVDPETGAVLRLAVSATLDLDREPDLPVKLSEMVIEYAPVKIGGGTYVCPVRSVSVSRGRTVRDIHEWGKVVYLYGPFEDLIDEATFSQYHRFGSESRILTDAEPAQQ